MLAQHREDLTVHRHECQHSSQVHTKLEDKRLIDTEPTKIKIKAGLVRNGNLLYTIRPIQEAVNYKLEEDLAALPEQKRTKKKR